MKPEDNNEKQSLSPVPKHNGQFSNYEKDEQNRQAASNVIRSQIDEIFKSGQEANDARLDENPYKRDHTENSAQTTLAKNWKEYHSAWQNYYQKYYEGYYRHQYKNKEGDEKSEKEEAVLDMRRRLLEKVQHGAKKVRKSHHFVPILAGLATILILLFVQYNQIIISNIVSYVSPGNINPQDIIINSDDNTTVSSETKLIIPKINVDVPIIWNATSDYNSQMAAMQKGVAHFAVPGADSYPGQVGNTVLAGHSSNDLFDTGDYKFIFAQLDKLVKGDTVYINYNSTRYTYIVTGQETVNPTDVNKLIYETTKPVLTLITCTPLGTAKYRLLVSAEQISPDPSLATKSGSSSSTSSSSSMPGTSKTLFEKIISLFNGGN